VRQHADGRAITLTNLGPGEIFGELAMFGGEVRSATVEAIDDVQAVAILAGDLKRLLNDHPEIAVKLLGALAERLRETNARIARQSFQKVSSRVAGVLAELAETGSRGQQFDSRTGQASAEIVVHSTQADLAQLAGTSREAASRFLATLQRAGIVTCKRGRVIVHDPFALQRYIY
jgi:CRP/FNR family transcriptional regulator